MSILADLAPELEVYSIDEAFVNLVGIQEIQSLGAKIVNQVTRGTGIPVSLGIGATKTLAKVANKFAKKYPAYNRICIIDTEEKKSRLYNLLTLAMYGESDVGKLPS